MPKIIITGYSDDNIEIEGDIREEYSWFPEDSEDTRYIAISDGTVLSARYDNDGLWRFNPVAKGSATYSKVYGLVTEDTNDVVTLEGDDISWVTIGVAFYGRKASRNDS
jgi:hypothetical protein